MQWKAIITDGGSFAAGLAATWILGWSTRDLLWGLWISSLTSGAFFYVSDRVRKARIQTVPEALFGFIGLVFGLGFFLVHFGAFHYVQASILNLLIPLEPDPGRVYLGHLSWKGVKEFSLVGAIPVALSRYWLFIALVIVHEFVSVSPELREKDDFFRPYLFVIKMHFVMFALGALYSFGLESFPVYVMVLLFFFMPPSLKFLLSKKNMPESDAS
jgi:hypothetical protein